MDISHPANATVLAYLSRGGKTSPQVIPPDGVKDPYYGLGSHPDIVREPQRWLSLRLNATTSA
jgi:hypothetical protein